MRARWWQLLAAGLLLLGVCVAFFVVTTVRDNQFLHNGTRVTGIVIGHRPAAGWNPMDNGRAIVRYPTPAGEQTRQIWLDDTQDAPAAGPWTLVYDPKHPGRVRSLTDANDPVPWAPPMLVLGLAGLILIGLGTAKGLSRRGPKPAAAGCVLVRRYRLFSRPAWIEVADGTVRITLPSYFGTRPMLIPIDEVCVVDSIISSADYDSGGVYRRPVVLPYFPVTSPNVPPNLALFFTRPQRLPPLRRFGAVNASLSYRASRSEDGLAVDGLYLRVVDPARSVEVLAAAGVSRTDRPARWLDDHHPVTWDPIAIRKVARRDSRRRWLGLLVIVGFIGLSALDAGYSGWALNVVLPIAGTALLLLLVPWWARRRDRSEDSAGRHEADRLEADRHEADRLRAGRHS